MAPPRVDAETPIPGPPGTGTSIAMQQAQASWEKSLVRHLNKFKRYPDAARAGNRQGDVRVKFTLDRAGQVVATDLVGSSGSVALDQEALAVLQRASPFPAPPVQVVGASFEFTLPIQFRVR
jgi:protein TonB